MPSPQQTPRIRLCRSASGAPLGGSGVSRNGGERHHAATNSFHFWTM
jgi:hypothetical protein